MVIIMKKKKIFQKKLNKCINKMNLKIRVLDFVKNAGNNSINYLNFK